MPQVRIEYTEKVTETWVAKVDVPQDIINQGEQAIKQYIYDADDAGDIEDRILTESHVEESMNGMMIK